MEQTFGSYYPDDDLGDRRLPDNSGFLRDRGILRMDTAEADALGAAFRQRLEAGDTLHLLGLLGTTHNSGLALVQASRDKGVVLLANFEEERFSEVKHFAGYPARSVAEMKEMLAGRGLSPGDIFGVFYGYDVVEEEQSGMRMLLTSPKIIRNEYYRFVSECASPTDFDFDPSEVAHLRKNIFSHSPALAAVFRRLATDLGLRDETPCVQMRHHENHAYYAYGASPFANTGSNKITMISCVDGGGDLSSVSLFQAQGDAIDLLKRNRRAHSLGVFYMICASLLGGWTALSAEGRYMGAAAWGDGCRLTNPYYRRLREYFHFGAEGEVFVNNMMTENNFSGLERVMGPFVALNEIWKPDAVLNVDDVQHSPVTRERVDKAAAVQMVFEDALFHIIADLIDRTRSDQLILCGGTALNCVASMRLLEHFDRDYYRRRLGLDTRLNVWAPPIPSDQGVVAGAPYQFAMLNGGRPTGTLPTPFLCGRPPSCKDIDAALSSADFVECEDMGDVSDPQQRRSLADWMAFLVARGGVLGLYQGAAETGPRALGHRSILSNPCDPDTLEVLNSRVKLRERIRPLAPMVTLEEAGLWFDLSEGAHTADYCAYDYMVLTARAKPIARARIPAVVHFDGTSRIQIVRESNNALVYDYLKALKPHIGVEVSVNTSLNVGTPIVQTPEQALKVFQRSKGLDAIIMVASEGRARMVWAKPGVQPIESRAARLWSEYRAASFAVPPVASAAAPSSARGGLAAALQHDHMHAG